MSRVSTLVLGTVALAVVATVSGCRVSVETKNRFIEPNVVKEDSADWAGQPIEIKIEGVGLAQNGGVTVTSNPNTKRVKATARMLAQAFTEEKSNADQSIVEAKETFQITNTSGLITVSCGHGSSHGSSNGGESGCELIEIEVPAGDATNPLQLPKVLSGNGTLRLSLSNATLTNLGANAAIGDINADLPATQGGTISLVSEGPGDTEVGLPRDFSADEVIIQDDSNEIELGPFSDIKNGASAGGRGTAGTGLKSLKITSKGLGGIKLR